MKHYILAHDLGTTGNKATLYDQEGALVGSAFSGYGTAYAHTGWAEQNPEDWWQAICASTKALLSQAKIAPGEVAAISFSGQMMGAVPLDRQARPLRNAIIWADQRSVSQVIASAHPTRCARFSGSATTSPIYTGQLTSLFMPKMPS